MTRIRVFSLLVFGALAITLVASGCVSSAPASSYRPVFDYSPPSAGPRSETPISLALVGAQMDTPVAFFQAFRDNMANDFQEILSARGYTIRGPFRRFDDMTFPDKKGSQLALEPQLEIDADMTRVEEKVTGGSFGLALLGAKGVRFRGTVIVSGHINLVLYEPLTREKMWTKSLEIEPQNIALDTERLYPGLPPIGDLLAGEPAFAAALGHALENAYSDVLTKAYVYLDPEEVTLVSQQAEDLRKRKVY